MCVILLFTREQPLKELPAKVCDSHTSSLTDCLQWFNPRRHSSLRNVSTGLQELTDFFEALVIRQVDHDNG